MIIFCPKCRKPAFRVEIIPVAEIIDWEMIIIATDNEIEDICTAELTINILQAPKWRAIITGLALYSSSISLSCPWCPKGKIVLRKKLG